MCGIVGIYHKNKDLNQTLGSSLAAMLTQMSERGPDSAGVAVYRDAVASPANKICVYSPSSCDWSVLQADLATAFDPRVDLEVHASHARLVLRASVEAFSAWLRDNYPSLRITSAGQSIEIYKASGAPSEFVQYFGLPDFSGTHGLGHTRMATESAVTTEHSHPFSTGMDLCLVHNGSLSNHNRLRKRLQDHGVEFQTDNDSEVAAGYLMWRMREGDSLEAALENALSDLDGFYTLAIGTRNGFAVLRDPIACKPAVLAETDDWVAMASEFRAIAQLDGVEHATIWEPEPATTYVWGGA